MVANRMESPRSGGESPKGGSPHEAPPAEHAAPKAAGPGFKAWLPLVVSVVIMPLLAYATATFVLVPKVQHTAGKTGAEAAKSPGKGAKKNGGEGGAGVKKVSVPLKKVLVNVAGTQGTRFLLANMTLVGTGQELKPKIEEHQDQLVDLASGILASKTISDLEKPGARNFVRTELIAAFNHVLGNNAIQEIYLTEFAIQ
jgi:flagellar FliL protein